MNFLLIYFPEQAHPGTRQASLADGCSWKCLKVDFTISQVRSALLSEGIVTLMVLPACSP